MKKKRSIYVAGLLALIVTLAGCSDELEIENEEVNSNIDVTTVDSSLPANSDDETLEDGQEILAFENFNNENSEEKLRVKDHVQYDKIDREIALDMVDRKLQVVENFNSNYVEIPNPIKKVRIKAEVQYEKEINDGDNTVITDEEIKSILGSNENTSDSSGGVLNSNEKVNSNQCVNLNTASLEELKEIEHIGEERAQEVIDKREYKKVEDLININGIGQERIKEILAKNEVCVS